MHLLQGQNKKSTSVLPENARVHTVYTITNFKQLLRFQLEEYHNQIHDNDKTFYFKKAYC